jgi:hypothetical protein
VETYVIFNPRRFPLSPQNLIVPAQAFFKCWLQNFPRPVASAYPSVTGALSLSLEISYSQSQKVAGANDGVCQILIDGTIHANLEAECENQSISKTNENDITSPTM